MAKGRPKKRIDKERGRRLKECINAAGMSVIEFSDKTGLAEGSTRNIISGQRSLTDDIAIRAAEILDVRPAYLLNLDNYRTNEDIISHPVFPFVAALVDAAKRSKALDAYLSSFHMEIEPDEEVAKKFCVDEEYNNLEVFFENESAYTITKDRETIGHCSEQERAAFVSDINNFVEYSINKLIRGGYKHG